MTRITTIQMAGLIAVAANAQPILIQDVRIFNGVDLRLQAGHVLIDEGVIQRVSADPIDAPADATVIDGANRVLTPGLIDLARPYAAGFAVQPWPGNRHFLAILERSSGNAGALVRDYQLATKDGSQSARIRY